MTPLDYGTSPYENCSFVQVRLLRLRTCDHLCWLNRRVAVRFQALLIMVVPDKMHQLGGAYESATVQINGDISALFVCGEIHNPR